MAQSGRAPAWGVGGRRFESDHPDQKNKGVVNTSTETSVNNFFDLAASPKLRDILTSFIYSSAHKSPKTIKTLHETLGPFVDYLDEPRDITTGSGLAFLVQGPGQYSYRFTVALYPFPHRVRFVLRLTHFEHSVTDFINVSDIE